VTQIELSVPFTLDGGFDLNNTHTVREVQGGVVMSNRATRLRKIDPVIRSIRPIDMDLLGRIATGAGDYDAPLGIVGLMIVNRFCADVTRLTGWASRRRGIGVYADHSGSNQPEYQDRQNTQAYEKFSHCLSLLSVCLRDRQV
jgi:hypothetical protein